MLLARAYIRDCARNIRMPFLDEALNIPDVAAKVYGGRGIYHKLVRLVAFTISCLRRETAGELLRAKE